MWEKIKKLLRKHRALLAYAFFGVLTTVVNYLIYLPLYNAAGLSGAASNAVAWLGSVIFAFFVNKPFVYQSHDWHAKVAVPEFFRFLGCRAGSGMIETGAIFLFVDCLRGNGNVIKILVSVIVIIINYIGGKVLVFRAKK